MPLPLALLAAAPGIIEGGVQIGQSLIGRKDRIAEQLRAKNAYKQSRADYMNLDTTNPYANMENTMEDLTVNTQQADFMAQQTAQGSANILSSMNQSAGGSGIAALAQSLANQQAQSFQKSSASIGQQESRNQALSSREAGRVQSMERQGEMLSRNMKRNQAGTMLGMDMADLSAANQARTAAGQAFAGGIGQIAGGVADGIGAYKPQANVDKRYEGAMAGFLGGEETTTDPYNSNDDDEMLDAGIYDSYSPSSYLIR